MEMGRGVAAAVAVGVAVLVVLARGGEGGQLAENFYSLSCPAVELVVRQAVIGKMLQTFVAAPATLRIFFHDCFIEGCDASIMVASPNGDADKDSPDNLSLAGDGFDTIIKAKEAVEAQCPGVVSCADIMAMAARDVVFLSGGPFYAVELGRRDGLVSAASRVPGKLPQPSFDLNLLNWIFRRNNLTQTDMIALSGAHTIGFSHCSRFSRRLYSYSRSSPVDPSLDPAYASQLMSSCPPDVDPTVAVNMDPATPTRFDNLYYQNLQAGKGMFTSDQVLFTDPASRPTVGRFAVDPGSFSAAFVEAMKKLGRVGVKTGEQGEIRKECTAFNS